jgi:hypothetical protein
MVVGRVLEIWSSDMDLMEDTWSEVSLGSSGMAIMVRVVQIQRTYLLLFATKGDRFQEAVNPLMIYARES